MARRRRLGGLPLPALFQRRSVRFRLTALYCLLFFPSGVVLVAITYVLIVVFLARTNTVANVIVRSGHTTTVVGPGHGGTITGLPAPGAGTSGNPGVATVAVVGHGITLDPGQLLVASCVVLIAMIGASVLFGWLAAGRVLRPLRVITATTRRISERNLHERLALAGPDDELKDLGDTIDGLLARLEAAFESQRRFVANASHELRTPLMLSQTVLQVALADPGVTLDSLRAACQEAIDAGKDQAQLIDALLTLARSHRGLDHRQPVDLTAVVNDALNTHKTSAAARGLVITTSLDRAEVPGDAHLLSRLVTNLLDNAIRYNIPGGRIGVELAASTTAATLTIANTGPRVPPDQVSRLLEPFQRAAPDRSATPSGFGLGLSIVADIAEAHAAGLEIRPRPDGGLTVIVRLPADLDRPDDEGAE